MAFTVNRLIRASVVLPPVPAINFTEGVPSSFDLTPYLPVGADRYHGGFYDINGSITGNEDYLPGVSYSESTKKIVYDGSLLSSASGGLPALTPNTNEYFVGYEGGPYNAHWQFPPRTYTSPGPVGGVSVSLNSQSKHTRPRWCPYDNLLYIFGGDYTVQNLQPGNAGGANGEMLLWKMNPTTNVWALAFPAKGIAGQPIPLASDLMCFTWDSLNQVFWCMHGSCRPGFASAASWTANGGLGTAIPSDNTNGQPQFFAFDPKLSTPTYILMTQTVPWNLNLQQVCECTFDPGSNRVYAMQVSASKSLTLFWLDVTNYATNAAGMAWAQVDLSLAVGAAENLTGTGIHQFVKGPSITPLHVDTTNKLLYFVDTRNPAILAVTLPGNALGTHKITLIADLATKFPALDNIAPFYGSNATAMPFMWIPEHRSLVLMGEPWFANVGPSSVSLTINVDTGVVTDGPRFPNRSDGGAWFCDAGTWFVPTQELILYGHIIFEAGMNIPAQLQTNAYSWVP
jgi:hypothetical protein